MRDYEFQVTLRDHEGVFNDVVITADAKLAEAIARDRFPWAEVVNVVSVIKPKPFNKDGYYTGNMGATLEDK